VREPEPRGLVAQPREQVLGRSTAITCPVGPTACAAGIADAPLPEQTSSTRIPGRRPRRSMVRAPKRSQKVFSGAS
jgi:hypothetical protein